MSYTLDNITAQL